MKKIEQYIKEEMKDCPFTQEQEDKLLIGLTKFLDDLETEQLRLNGVGRSFIHELIQKENVLKTKLSENLDLYKERNNMVEYDKTFSQWNKCNLVLWDLKDILCRMGEDID